MPRKAKMTPTMTTYGPRVETGELDNILEDTRLRLQAQLRECDTVRERIRGILTRLESSSDADPVPTPVPQTRRRTVQDAPQRANAADNGSPVILSARRSWSPEQRARMSRKMKRFWKQQTQKPAKR